MYIAVYVRGLIYEFTTSVDDVVGFLGKWKTEGQEGRREEAESNE
jgi:hypothetical protein